MRLLCFFISNLLGLSNTLTLKGRFAPKEFKTLDQRKEL